MKNELYFVFHIFYENGKGMKVLKIQRKNLLNMKIVVSYLNFVFFIEVKAKSKYRILNFVFQFIKKTKWHFGYTDCITPPIMNSLFTLHLNQYNLRNYQELLTEKRNTVNYGQETVTYRAPILWPKSP